MIYLLIFICLYCVYHSFPIIVTFKMVHSKAKKPSTAYGKAACYDVYSVDDITIPPNQWRELPIGIIFAPWPHIYIKLLNLTLTPLGNVAYKIHTRSGLAAKGQRSHLGIIDNDYREEITIIMFNHNTYPLRYHIGDKVAQIEFYKVPKVVFWQKTKLSKSLRGNRGFGSSGNS